MKKVFYYISIVCFVCFVCFMYFCCGYKEYIDYKIKYIEIRYIDFTTEFIISNDCTSFNDSSNCIVISNLTIVLDNHLTDSREVLKQWRLKLSEEMILDTIRNNCVDSVFLSTHTKTMIIDGDTIKYASYISRTPNVFSKIIITDSIEILEFSNKLFNTKRDTIPEVSIDTRARIVLYYKNGKIDEICMPAFNYFKINDHYIQMGNYEFYNYLCKFIKRRDVDFDYW